MKHVRTAVPSLCIALAVICGCKGMNAIVTDAAGVETQVTDVRVSGDPTLGIQSGGSVRSVPIEACSEINVYPEESRTIGGNLYFLASFVFADGSRLSARDSVGEAITFLRVNDAVTGESNKGPFSIPLAKVKKIRYVEK